MQVDFGEIRVKKISGGTIKLYVMAAVLAHSRYKCGVWSDKPLTTTMFLEMLERCLREIGIPRELVFDQDRLLAISENFGDIIYTADFERFRRTMGFSVHLCRAKDPESKGKVEAVVKYVKNNSKDIVLKAITYCSERHLYSTTDCRDTVLHLTTKLEPLMDASVELPVEYRVKTEVRSIAAYASLLRGAANE